MTGVVKVAGICGVALLCMLLLTDPQELPSIALIVPFALLFITLAAGTLFGLGAYGVSGRRKFRIGLIASAIPVALLVLQSLGQLTLLDALVILAVFGIAYFYVSRLSAQAPG